MYWGWGSQMFPLVGSRLAIRSGGVLHGSLFLFRQAAGKSPAHRCQFGSSSWWMSRTTGSPWARLACLTARRRSRFSSCSRVRCSRAHWSAGSGQGSFGGTMSPCRRSRSRILWWKVKVIRAARNVIVAPTNAEVNSNTRSNTSLFIGG